MARNRISIAPLELAHAIADEFSRAKVHGRFTFEAFPRRGTEWHKYRAVFYTLYGTDAILNLIYPFETFITNFYSGLSQLKIYFIVENDEGEAVENIDIGWRSITHTRSVSATFSQANRQLGRWQLLPNASSKYLSVKGVQVEVLPGTNYKRGRLYNR